MDKDNLFNQIIEIRNKYLTQIAGLSVGIGYKDELLLRDYTDFLIECLKEKEMSTKEIKEHLLEMYKTGKSIQDIKTFGNKYGIVNETIVSLFRAELGIDLLLYANVFPVNE